MSEYLGRIGRMEVSWPWGNAGGVIKTYEELEAMVSTAVGWAEAGSFTIEKRYGNKKDPETGELKIDPETSKPLVDYYHDPVTGESGNSLGMPNPGRDELVGQIPEMNRLAATYKKEVVYNVAPVSDDPVTETQELVHSFASAGARRVLVNGGCPNVEVPGGDDEARHELLSRDADMTYLTLHGLQAVTDRYPDLDIYYRLSPQETFSQAGRVYTNILRAGTVRAVWTPNTWPGYKPMKDGKPALTIKGNIGGRSGPAVAEEAMEQVVWALTSLRGSGIDVVASSGIANSEALQLRAAKQLKRVLDLGAVAGAGTTFYYEIEHGWKDDTDRMLTELGSVI